MTSYPGCSRRYGIPRVARTPPNLSRTTSSENSKPTSVRSPAANDASRRQNSISSECIPKRRRSRRGRIRECCAKTIAAFSTVYPKIFSGNGGVCPLARVKPGSPADQAELLQELPALISTFSKADCEVPVLLSASPNDYYDSPPSPQPEVPTWNSTVAAGCACQSPGFNTETAQGSPDECGVVESLLDSSNGLPDGEGGLHGVLGSAGDSNSAPGDPPSPPGVSGEYVNREHLAGEGAYYSAFRALRRSRWETDCCRGDDVASAHVAPWGMRLVDKIKAEKWMNAMSFCSSDWSERDGQHGLSLNLNYQEIVDAWSDRGSVYVDEQCPQTVPGDDEDDDVDSPTASVDIGLVAGLSFWRVEDENGIQCNHTAEEDGTKSGIREARVLRYKEKRQARLFCKKIRYQVRKINAERRPRMKGRFVKRLADL